MLSGHLNSRGGVWASSYNVVLFKRRRIETICNNITVDRQGQWLESTQIGGMEM